VRSIRNAIKYLGYTVRDVTGPQDLGRADVNKLVFPGVGAFGSAMHELEKGGYAEALREYIRNDRPFFGICIGMQVLFEGSEENAGVEGLGLVEGTIQKFSARQGKPVPHIGWNTIQVLKDSPYIPRDEFEQARLYFVHSYHGVQANTGPAMKKPKGKEEDWLLAQCDYLGDKPFVAAVGNGSNVMATQFHPEKSGDIGLSLMDNFLSADHQAAAAGDGFGSFAQKKKEEQKTQEEEEEETLAKRVIACLDVRSNDNGDLVVTKGDQYDVRDSDSEENEVRNLGKPVELATKYFKWGADEVTFLNITGFRDFPLGDLPMLEVLRKSSEKVFVPLTVGGGIREFTDSEGVFYSSLDVASKYFQSGADKVSIGSEAVYAAENYWTKNNKQKKGDTSIEQISDRYGKQAVVISIDPRRVYVADPSQAPALCKTTKTSIAGPKGEDYCWWQCTVKGGREGRDIGAYEVALAVEALGAGEILLNCIDRDGTGKGFDLELINLISDAVNIPVIASSGAGNSQHFIDVFKGTNASAALAAGIFHREEVKISSIKSHMITEHIPTRSDT
jgi:glutamine amidotransferase/cyclase